MIKVLSLTPELEMWLGISTDESQRMRLSRDPWMVNHYPLIELGYSRSDCLAWLAKHGVNAPRSACIGCPFRSPEEWRDMKLHYPEEFEEACRFDEHMRTRGGDTGDLYIYRSAEPLREVDLSTPEDHGQINMWSDECAGMCGV